MKKTLVFIVLALGWILCKAAPLQNVPIELTQPDGMVLKVFASGDEFYNWVHDSENYTILPDETGWYVYAVQNGEDISPGTLIVGRDKPASLIPGINKSERLVAERTAGIRSHTSQNRQSRTPGLGHINNIVVFVKFADDPEFGSSFSEIADMYNATGYGVSSLKQYYLETSYSQLTIESSFYPSPLGEIILSYTDSYPRGYFRPLSETNPIGYGTEEWDWILRERQLIARIINVMDQDVPESLIVDADNDGYVDNVCFIIQGVTDGWAEMLWPHMSIMSNPDVTINGAIVSQYNFLIESFIVAYYGGVSVLAHEMFHSIGAPDLYRYTNQSITPVGHWDLMANNTVPPQQTAAWMKYKYGGWVTVPLPIMQSGTYSLSPLGTSSTNISYRINSWRANEYYILEYRKPGEYIDTTISGTGLLVYRLLLNTFGNAEGPPDELYIYRPHSANNNIQGVLSLAAMSQQSGFTAINETTVPSGFTSINTPGGLNIYEVGEAGETISFKVKISDVQLTSPLSGDVLISGSSSQIRWKAKNFSGNVKIQLSTDLGQNWTTITESTPNNGNYTWQNIPVLDSQECLIRLSLLSSYHFDESTYPFGIVSTLAIPVPLYPLDNAQDTPTNPLVTWQVVPGATAYHFQLSLSQSFESLIVDVSTHSHNSYQVSGLNPFSTYYWRVASYAGGVYSDFCHSSGFSTGEISEIPAVPVLVSPTNYATNLSITPLLSWSNVHQASSYWVQISQSGYFNDLVCETTDVTTNSWIPPALQKHSSYYWRVASSNPAGSSNFSGARRFSTGDGTGLTENDIDPVINKLGTNYPNPFNPQTTIRLKVADIRTPLKVSVYNMKGQFVKKLYDGLPDSKSLSLIWDSRDEHGNILGSGVYLYKMEAGSYIETRKMLLVK